MLFRDLVKICADSFLHSRVAAFDDVLWLLASLPSAFDLLTQDSDVAGLVRSS